VAGILGLTLAGGTAAVAPDEAGTTAGSGALRGFLYLEPFEMRLEWLAKASLLGENAPRQITEANRAEVMEAMRRRLEGVCIIRADGEPVPFELDRIQFVIPDSVRGPVRDERQTIPPAEATVGMTFGAARSGFPERVEADWRRLPEPLEDGGVVPLKILLQTRGASFSRTLEFEPGNRTASWVLPDLSPVPGRAAVPEEGAHRRKGRLIVGGLLLLGAAVFTVVVVRRRGGPRVEFLIGAGVLILIGLGSLADAVRGARPGALGDEEGRALVESLLGNVYGAFAYREESTIFDALAESVDGPLLEKLYLEIRRGLVLEGDGPRVKLVRVDLTSCEIDRDAGGPGFQARAAWSAVGTVQHWGHAHSRRNVYRADLRLEPVDGQWKLVEVDLLEEARL